MKSVIGALRLVAWVEGLSFLGLLFVAMPLKYVWKDPFWVQMLGRAHGGLVVLLLVLLMMCHQMTRTWTLKKSLHTFVVSLVPFAVFWYDSHLRAFIREEESAK